MKEGILISMRELNRYEVVSKARRRVLTTREAGRLLSLSERQVRRIKARVEKKGLKGVIHGNKGRAPVNKTPQKVREKVVKLLEGKYQGLNTLHFQEKLEDEGIQLGRESIRKIYIERGIARRKHKRRRRFSLRERMPQAGLMLQMDSSLHDWLSTGEETTLIACIDDATNEVPYASLFPSDTTSHNMQVLKKVVERKGVFKSLYVDKAPHFTTTRKGGTHLVVRTENFSDTQVERALGELGITMINAHTPQAKGRVERLFQLLQDRFLKELKLKGITDIKEANKFLWKSWLPSYNRKFSIKPLEKESAYLPLSREINLDGIFCCKFERKVNYDNTISFQKKIYEILPDSYRICFAKATVEVRQHFNGRIKILHNGRHLKFATRTKSLGN